MEQSTIDILRGAQEMQTLEKYEFMPLKKRLKFLLSACHVSFDSDVKPEIGVCLNAERKGNKDCQSQSGCSTKGKVTETVSTEERDKEHINLEMRMPVKCTRQESLAHKHIISSQTIAAAANMSERFGSVHSSSLHQLLSPKHPDTPKVKHADNCNPSTDQRSGSSQAASQAVHFEPETCAEFPEELDHLVLKERLKRLLTRKLGLMKMPLEENCSRISIPAFSTNHLQTAGTGKGELALGDQRLSVDDNQNYEIQRTLESESSKCDMNPSIKAARMLSHCSAANKFFCAKDSQDVERDDTHSSDKNHLKHDANCGKVRLSGDIRTVQDAAAPKLTSIKVEPLDQNSNTHAATPKLTNIKVEPPNYCDVQNSNATRGQTLSIDSVPQKTEVERNGAYQEDKLDHLLLRERMKLLPPKDELNCNISKSTDQVGKSAWSFTPVAARHALQPKDEPNLNISQISNCTNQVVKSAFSCTPAASRSAQLPKVNQPRKRRKTVTDSIETAMEEDAPGLLQVLIQKGVSVNEIKLYGEPESNDALDDTQTEDSFAELEEVIAKLFSRRESFLKFGPLRCTKVEKASYCLECLVSLVEQARYLQFRNWPAEWGWCRDLQSFIFVFERHNRIVLERPEYGYATYFFELAESLPINWQIKRLLTVMKLTNCSRITIIENKALKVGDDLSEGEARVLMEYGWTPDTGLGTMLNYYDRVVHDRKSERDGSEWRTKIGKLLMDGYNGGTVVSSGIPRKVMEYNIANPVQIKLERFDL